MDTERSLEFICNDSVVTIDCPYCLKKTDHHRCSEKPNLKQITWKCSICRKKQITDYQLNFISPKKSNRGHQ